MHCRGSVVLSVSADFRSRRELPLVLLRRRFVKNEPEFAAVSSCYSRDNYCKSEPQCNL